jgi:FHS family L-fucose permease-like MFS transporter
MANTATPAPSVANPAQRTDHRAMSVVTALFFMWGFVTCLNDILIPHLKSIFDLNYTEVMLVQFAFFSAYFVFSFPAGKIIDYFGYSKTMVAGLVTMGVGALAFVPAARVPSFQLFLGALITLAAGMTLLQTAANPYVAVLGPPKTASSRLNLAQAFNSLGTTLAPWFGSRLILGGVAGAVAAEILRTYSPQQLQVYRASQASSVKTPYVIISVTLFVLALILAFYRLPTIPQAEPHGEVHDSVWRYRHLVLGAVAIFVYVGAEVAIGSLMANYLNHSEIGNLSLADAAHMLQYYWGGAMVGRFVGAALLQKIRTNKLLAIHAVFACALVLISTFSTGDVAMWSLLAVGLFNSIMFPAIFTLGIAGLGPLTGEGSALLVAAIVGGAIIPEFQGILADKVGLHHSFMLPALCYIYIALYAWKGSLPRSTPSAI